MKHKRIKKVENITRWKFSEVLIEAEVEYFFSVTCLLSKQLMSKKFFLIKKNKNLKIICDKKLVLKR